MLIDILAALSAGAGIAGLILILRWLSRSRLPKWSIPVALGAGILGFSVWSEYSWLPRVTAALPPGVVVLMAPQDHTAMRPWTYVFPLSTRFLALDRTNMRTSEANPAIRLADVMVVERWTATKRIPMGFDCAAHRHADLVEGAALSAEGVLTGGHWLEAAPDDVLMTAACKEG